MISAHLKQTFRGLRRQMAFRMFAASVPSGFTLTENIVIVAAHPDDETFGTGGLIAKARSLSANRALRVSVIFLTSGGSSHKGCCELTSAELEQNREVTSRRATETLGLSPTDLYYLRLPDGALPHPGQPGYDEACQLLADLLSDIRPTQIFTTHPDEGWSDHSAAARLTMSARTRAALTCEVYYYCVWLPVSVPLSAARKVQWRTGRKMDIADCKHVKAQAVQHYLDHKAPCGQPYCGRLPQSLIRASTWDKELFFRADDGVLNRESV
jgi:LmbE family N-acetylglucosaminyl deacetylase